MRMFVLELFQLTRGFISQIWVFWATMENDPGPFSLVQIDELSARLSAALRLWSLEPDLRPGNI